MKQRDRGVISTKMKVDISTMELSNLIPQITRCNYILKYRFRVDNCASRIQIIYIFSDGNMIY